MLIVLRQRECNIFVMFSPTELKKSANKVDKSKALINVDTKIMVPQKINGKAFKFSCMTYGEFHKTKYEDLAKFQNILLKFEYFHETKFETRFLPFIVSEVSSHYNELNPKSINLIFLDIQSMQITSQSIQPPSNFNRDLSTEHIRLQRSTSRYTLDQSKSNSKSGCLFITKYVVAYMYSNQNNRTEVYDYALIEKFNAKNEQLEPAKVQITGMREVYSSGREVERFNNYYMFLLPLYGRGGSELQGVQMIKSDGSSFVYINFFD